MVKLALFNLLSFAYTYWVLAQSWIFNSQLAVPTWQLAVASVVDDAVGVLAAYIWFCVLHPCASDDKHVVVVHNFSVLLFT